jgi:RNA 3'-terminal phosphate cyclase (ATP)
LIEINGSLHSGSGTILRYAAALATLVGEPLHMHHIRAGREKPGLRPQHLIALRACRDFSSGRLEGDEINSREITYTPGPHLNGGIFRWDIGTAGSTTMLAFTLLPLALFARGPSTFAFAGGLFQDFAPSAFHMQRVLLPLIMRMGAEVQLEIIRPGYVPEGKGILTMNVKNLGAPMEHLAMLNQGNIRKIQGVALSSHLKQERVSERMADQCYRLLQRWKYPLSMDICYDESAVQKGAALMLCAETDTGCLLGSDQAGKRGRRSERIADFVVESLMEDLRTGATTDRHLADQLILFAALAKKRTQYLLPALTDHVQTNLWLVERFLGAKADLRGKHLTIEGIGLDPSRVG